MSRAGGQKEGGGDGDGGEGRRLSSLRTQPDLLGSSSGSKKKFAPKIPARVVKQEPDVAGAGSSAGGSGAAGGSGSKGSSSSADQAGGPGGGARGGGRGKGGERGRGRGRGADTRPAAPQIVTFRGTGAGPGAKPVALGSANSAAYAGGAARAKSSKGGTGGSGSAADHSPMVPMPGMSFDEDQGVVDKSMLPVTLPLTPVPPWEESLLQISDETLEDQKRIRKAVRSIGKSAAIEILGEQRIFSFPNQSDIMRLCLFAISTCIASAGYAAILRGEQWSPEAIGLTPELFCQIESRRLLENPHAATVASGAYFSKKQEDAHAAAQESEADPSHPGFHLNAASVLHQQGEGESQDQLLLFQLPHSLPFASEGHVADMMDEDDPKDEWEGPPPQTPSPLTGQPSGRMGKMRVHQSGRVTLKLGSLVFDVTEAAQCNFLQQVVARQEQSDDLYHLGDVKGRLLITPDLEGLLNNLDS